MSRKALNELESARLLSSAGIQLVSSVVLTDCSDAILKETADKLGFPVVMKILSDDICRMFSGCGGILPGRADTMKPRIRSG